MAIEQAIRLGSEYFNDPNVGRPVFNGSVYIGKVDFDPKNIADRITVTVIEEDGTRVAILPAAQPLLTGTGGTIIYNGKPVSVVTDLDYSIRVDDSQGSQVYYFPFVQNNALALSLITKTLHDTVAVMVADTTLVVGVTVETKSYYAWQSPVNEAPKGGATYNIVSAADYTTITGNASPDGFGDHLLTNGLVALLSVDGHLEAHTYGIKGNGVDDDTLAIDSAVLYRKTKRGVISFPVGTYLYNGTIDIYNGMFWRGEGKKTIIKFTDINVFAFNVSGATKDDVTFLDMTFDGTSRVTRTQGWLQVGIDFSSFTLDRVYFNEWNHAVNSGVIHTLPTGKIFGSHWGILRFDSGTNAGTSYYDEGGGPSLSIDNLYFGNTDGATDMYIGVVLSNLIIGTINVGGASGTTIHSRGTSLSSLNVGLINHESSASPIAVVILADTQANIGAVSLTGLGQPSYGYQITEGGNGVKNLGPVHGIKENTALGHVQISTNDNPVGLVVYDGFWSEVDNNTTGQLLLSNVYTKKDRATGREPRYTARVKTTDDTLTTILSIPLIAGQVYHGVATFVGVTSGGLEQASYVRRFTVYRDDAASAVILGAVEDSYTNEATASWDVGIAVSTTNLQAEVTGVLATIINWHCKIELDTVGQIE